MKKKQIIMISLPLVFLLALVLASVAQELGGSGKKQDNSVAQGNGGLGLPDPPPTGFSVRYIFTGVINDTSGREATAVHCTNFGANPVDVRVEVWNTQPTTTYSGNATINVGWTQTFGTRNISSFPPDVILSSSPFNIYQGSGRVLTKQHSDVICTAQALDPTNDPPVFSSALDMHRP